MATARMTLADWDSSEHLKTPEAIATYLQAAMAEGGDDPAFVAHAIGIAARSFGLSQIAQQTGNTREGLHKALQATGNPTLATLIKVLGVLGLRLDVRPL